MPQNFLPEPGLSFLVTSPWEVADFEGEDAITMTVLVQKLQRPMKLFYTVAFSVAEIGFHHLMICHHS